MADSESLMELSEAPYEAEAFLQQLIADHPDLLAGEQLDVSEPRKWILVRREVPVSAEEGGGRQWSLDHLYIDQDAVPTLVEVKLASDTRSRREVVAQMLDYAANSTVYWPVDQLQEWFEERSIASGTEPELELEGLLGPDCDPELFWRNVETNLRAGRMRLVFVADRIPSPLRRIVEFLNVQMDPAEVIAIAIQQFVDSNHELRVYVPRVIGQTEQSTARRGRGSRKRLWNQDSVIQAFRNDGYEVDIPTVEAIVAWANQSGILARFRDHFGIPGCWFACSLGRRRMTIFSVKSERDRPIATIEFGLMRKSAPFDQEARRRELLKRLNSIPTIEIPSSEFDSYPSIDLRLLRDDSVRTAYLDTFDWAIKEARNVAESS